MACVIGAASPLMGCFQADPEDLELVNYREPATRTSADPSVPEGAGRSADASTPRTDEGPRLFGFDCVSPEQGDYHAAGYGAPDQHGADFKLQREDCRTCHGQNLEGCDFAGGCDNCHDGGHPAGWRTSCTYCHGGATNQTGAPPGDLLRNKPMAKASFLAHEAHVVGTLHAPYDCTQCHEKPTDVMSKGHAFDATPGAAEVVFRSGLSPAATYDGAGGCSNLYCHGNRRENGSIEHSRSATDCNSCHAYDDAKALSGRHDAHVNGGLLGFLFDRVACSECHADVVSPDGNIVGLNLHVNGQVDLSVAAQGIRYDGTRCNGTCHNAPHTFISTWLP